MATFNSDTEIEIISTRETRHLHASTNGAATTGAVTGQRFLELKTRYRDAKAIRHWAPEA